MQARRIVETHVIAPGFCIHTGPVPVHSLHWRAVTSSASVWSAARRASRRRSSTQPTPASTSHYSWLPTARLKTLHGTRYTLPDNRAAEAAGEHIDGCAAAAITAGEYIHLGQQYRVRSLEAV